MSFDTEITRSFRQKVSFGSGRFLPYSVATLATLLLIECIVFVAIPPADNYETSLVEALPLGFWFLFMIVLLGGIGVLLGAALVDHRYWPHGLALVLSNYALFLFLPDARGYVLYGRGTGDILFHLGHAQSLLNSGSLPDTWYPGTHVLMAELNMLGIPLETLQYLLAFLFTALHIVGVGILVRELSGRLEGLSIGLAAAVPLIYIEMHIAVRPATYSFLMLPVVALAFERYRRDSRFANIWVLLLLGLFIVYTHPMTTLLLTVLITVTAVYSTIHNRFVNSDAPSVSPRLALIFPMLLFSWLINYDRFRNAILRALEDSPSPGSTEVKEATQLSFTLLELAQRFLQLYGTIFIYGATAGLISLYLCKRLLRDSGEYQWGFSTAHYGVGLAIAATFVANGLIVGSVIRSSRYALMFAMVLIALGLLQRMLAGDKRVVAAIVLIILATSIVGVNSTYEPNKQLTYSEYDGTEYLLTNSPDSDIYSADTSAKMEQYVLGADAPGLYPEQMPKTNEVPRELGYDSESQTASDTFGDAMLVTKTYDMEQHTASYFTDEQQEFLRIYGQESVDRLNHDPTANRVYTNGGFEGWDIQPSNTDDG